MPAPSQRRWRLSAAGLERRNNGLETGHEPSVFSVIQQDHHRNRPRPQTEMGPEEWQVEAYFADRREAWDREERKREEERER
jgi:hypothetical protein